MLTENSVQTGQLYFNGNQIGVKNFNMEPPCLLVDEENDDIQVRKLDTCATFTGTFEMQLPKKFNKRKLKFYRTYLGIDLLAINFPKKKNRRKKRLWRRYKSNITQISTELNKKLEEIGLI